MLDGFRLHRARRDPASLAAFVLRDEATGGPVTLAPHHHAIQRLCSAHDRLVVWTFPEGGKTSQLTARIAFELALNPAIRINLVSGTSSQAERTVRSVKNLIESPAFQLLFPGFAVSMREGALTVEGRSTSAKDASLTPSGLGLGSVLGQRFDLVIGDDLLDLESTRTANGRESAWSAFLQVHVSRLVPGGRMWLFGTAWHTEDVLHRAAKLPDWASAKFPVLDAKGRSTWPERWPSERIEQRRVELGPIQFARVMLCQPIDSSTLVFTPEMLDAALLLGRTAHVSPIGGRGFLAVDPAWSVGPQSDLSAIIHVSVDGAKVRHVVGIEAARLNVDQLTDRLVTLSRANGKIPVYVESNGAGVAIVAAVSKQVPCIGLATTAQSKQRRAESLSAELASGRWAFSQPAGYVGEQLRALVDELSVFTLSADKHTGDRAAARLFEDRPRMRVIPNFALNRR